MTRPFIIYALPRSRTVWLSKFFTHAGWECKHDPLAEFKDLNKIAEWLRQPKRGIIDTGLVAGWRQMRELVPEARQITIRRDPVEVQASLEKLRLAHLIDVLKLDRMLDEVVPRWEYYFDELDDVNSCEDLSHRCTGQFDEAWWRCLKDANIQLDLSQGMPAHVAEYLNG